jgi:hypothetical protein
VDAIRMSLAETAALLTYEAFPDVPLRQWVTSLPFPLG